MFGWLLASIRFYWVRFVYFPFCIVLALHGVLKIDTDSFVVSRDDMAMIGLDDMMVFLGVYLGSVRLSYLFSSP